MVNHPLRKPYMDGSGKLAARTPAVTPSGSRATSVPKDFKHMAIATLGCPHRAWWIAVLPGMHVRHEKKPGLTFHCNVDPGLINPMVV